MQHSESPASGARVLGKVRHLSTSCLWVQEKESSREIQHHKGKGSDSSADLFTKALDHDSNVRHTEAMGVHVWERSNLQVPK